MATDSLNPQEWSCATPAGLVHVRPASDEDLPLMQDIYASTREQELSALPWGSEQKTAFVRMQFELQRQHYLSHFSAAQYAVLESRASRPHKAETAAAQPLGRLIWLWQSHDLRLIDIALLSSARQQGIGTSLLNALQAQAQDRACSMSLQVAQNNPAQSLYRRLGFQHVASQGGYLLMQWRNASVRV